MIFVSPIMSESAAIGLKQRVRQMRLFITYKDRSFFFFFFYGPPPGFRRVGKATVDWPPTIGPRDRKNEKI
jgi:hypothetical protein